MCVSYQATLHLMDELSKLHVFPLKKWIENGSVIKYIGDNLDKQKRVRDYRSDHQGDLLHMYSLCVCRSRTPAPELAHTGQISKLTEIPNEVFLPQSKDVRAIKGNLVILVSRILVQYFPAVQSSPQAHSS